MKIFGVGTDIVKVSRFKHSLKNKLFLTRIFNNKEIAKCKKKLNHSNCFAKRFAAKESFAKALGTGFRNNLNFKDLSVSSFSSL